MLYRICITPDYSTTANAISYITVDYRIDQIHLIEWNLFVIMLVISFITQSVCNLLIFSLFIGLFRNLRAQENEECTNPLDIFFLIDGSGSLGEEEFVRSKQLVSQILSMYSTSDRNRAGYAVFTSNINNVRYLTPELNNLLVHLEYEQYPATSTNLYKALQFVYQNVFKHGNRRENAGRVLVLLSDGNDERNVGELSLKLETERGVKILVFAFGNSISQAQLREIATDPDNNTLFMFPSVSEGIANIQMLSKAICPVSECCSRGRQGKRGARGLDGANGDMGEDGRTGKCRLRDPACTLRLRKGDKGFKGKRGPQGDQGTVGFKGVDGIIGFKGDIGEKGLKGINGTKGEKGEKRENGTKGPVGDQGDRGPKGEVGIKGEIGAQGLNGSKGEVGNIGVCRNSTFNTPFSCVGNKGEKGEIGQKGGKGSIGLEGDKGPKGLKGDQGFKGSNGEKGLKGNKGNQGEVGDAILYQSYGSSDCTEPGSIFFDVLNKVLYYCDGASMTHKCIGPGETGDCRDCQCVLSSGEIIQCNTTRLIFREASDCTSNVAVDFVIIVDDSYNNVESQEWIRTHVPLLNQKLLERCVGLSAAAPNLVQLIAFGAGSILEAPHFVTPDSVYVHPSFSDSPTTMRVNFLTDAINNLQNQQTRPIDGYREPGYSALDFALEYASLRKSTDKNQFIPMFIFITDEQTSDYSETQFESIVEKVRERSTLVLEFIVNPLKINTSSIDDLFGVAYSNAQALTVWGVDANGTEKSTVSSGSVKVYPRDDPMHRELKRDYMDLAMCTQRTSTHLWNMGTLLSSDAAQGARASAVFVSESAGAVIERAVDFSCQQCYCNGSEAATCIQLEEKLLCDCITSSSDRRCPCVREEIQNILEGKSQLSIPMVKLKCNIESPRVDIEVCRRFLVEADP